MVSLQALPMPPGPLETAALGAGNTFMKAAVRAAIYAALFVAAMEVVIALVRFGQNATPIWIASAVLAWALISSPTRDWPVVIGFALAAHVLRAAYYGDRPATEVIYLLANIGGPAACAGLMRWRDLKLDFEDRGSVLGFLLIAGVTAPALSAAAAALGSLVDPSRFELEDLGTWFLADALSYVVFLPVFMSIASGGWRDLMAPRLRLRAAVLFGVLILALVSEWFMPADWRRTFPTLLIPYLIFMVFELGLTGARAAIVVSTFGLLAYALFSSEIAHRGLDPANYIVSVQIYLAALVTCILPLAAALNEKQKLYETASEALGDAQAAWGSLIAAEAHYRLVADNSSDLVLRLDLDGGIMFASPACRLISEDVHQLEGQDIGELVHSEDRARVAADLEAFVAAARLDQPHTVRARLRTTDGAWKTFDIVSTLVASRGNEPEEIIAVLREVNA